eukprot:gene9703-1911_t
MSSDFERVCSAPSLSRHFNIVERIGAGGFSNVFKAVCKNGPLTGKAVALKAVKTTCEAARVEREIDCLHRVRESPRTATLIAVVKHTDLPILVLKYIPQSPLSSYDLMELNEKDIQQILHDLMHAIAFVHNQGIVHRDIKPSNFLYSRGQIGCLVDFGLARAVDTDRFMVMNPRDAIDLEHKFCKAKRPRPISSGQIIANDQVLLEDRRKPKRWNRAGTRGFRAPEVLLRCTYQSSAIDMWSTGIIALGLLCRRAHMFPATDDLSCLAEYMAVFGYKPLANFATILDKELTVGNRDAVPQEGLVVTDLQLFCSRLRPADHPQCLSVDARFRLTAQDAISLEVFQDAKQEIENSK